MEKHYEITNSEWAVMRILLSKSPRGSKEIISILKEQNNWSSATVKTFLSRLVSKKVIGYETVKNSFLYYPLVTEMTYVRDEMKSFFSRIYGNTIHYETQHFQFSGYNNQNYIRPLALSLEEYYEKVSTDLSIQLKRKQIIYIYSTQKELHSALGYENGPSWLTAGQFWEIVHLTPKDNFTGSNLEFGAFHALTQLLIYYINPRAPFWLLQGISAFESNWLSFDAIKKSIIELGDDLNRYSVMQISSDDDLFRIQHGYELTYSMIEYIVSRFGKKALLSLLKTPERLRFIFECSEDDFWDSWVDFVKLRYQHS
ncbi:MAG: BlaI/MecI/CopY family transcriptional regulator [Firmicutes bacterium]|nr:BlaI/MecI/CopY family transcriptional regulator [Bacillota bacterium]